MPIAVAILGVYLVKGSAAYLSGYLMTDVGQRVVRDLRNVLFRHILGQSAAFFSQQTTGRLMSRITNDVGQIQRVVSETIGDLTRESLALIGFAALLFYYDARLAILCLTGAPLVVYPLVRLGQRVRRSARRSQEALEQMSPRQRRGLHRPPHRQSVRRRGARDRQVRTGVPAPVPDQHAGDGGAVRAAAADGVHRWTRVRRALWLRRVGKSRAAG